MKLNIILTLVLSLLLAPFISFAQEDNPPIFTVTGKVTSVSEKQFSISEQVEPGSVHLFTFHITGETRITGSIIEGAIVTVTYTRIKRWHGFWMTAREVYVMG